MLSRSKLYFGGVFTMCQSWRFNQPRHSFAYQVLQFCNNEILYSSSFAEKDGTPISWYTFYRKLLQENVRP